MARRPNAIRCDNGPEYFIAVTMAWAARRGIRIDFIQPGQPQQNAYAERYNRTVRYDRLAHHLSRRSTKSRNFPHVGCGPTIMTGRTWPSAVSRPNKNLHLPLNVYF
ncbi:hypothetical protein DIR46_26035 [Massilia oculi]|uniref:Integrase catalytic domain-containing protein n=1 Tax=Massilia oculi TaxID=945844 RepID=A0A2S2DQ74_9BURK|nr:hypothetical protein DIR46_26035 [Massilia oculi]